MRFRINRSTWAAVAALAAVGALVALTLGSGAADRAARPADGRAPTPATPLRVSGGVESAESVALTPPSPTVDPGEYTTEVAGLILGFDTRRASPDDYRRVLRAETDPNLSPTGRDDLFATIDARIPADDLWQRMRANAQWSQWTPQRTWEPAAWSQVVTAGYAQPGWAMRNVTGTQTTHYQDPDGTARTSGHEATLSVVMRCPARRAHVDRCRLVLISTTPVF
jgi:hypothetical protein